MSEVRTETRADAPELSTVDELGDVWVWVEAIRDQLALRDPMEPDYEALGHTPITSTYQDSRDAAGIP